MSSMQYMDLQRVVAWLLDPQQTACITSAVVLPLGRETGQASATGHIVWSLRVIGQAVDNGHRRRGARAKEDELGLHRGHGAG